ncbi:MAG: SIS domain-containing protein, partial [Deltaproteobacteria bacterium]|nr:SIS domain-containing protein [Deltaproteobacteria bacterium]
MVAHTRRVVYLEDREIALVTADDIELQRLDGTAVNTEVEVISGDYDVADQRGYPHFMLKEIHEQPEAIERCLRGRIQEEEGNARLGGLNMTPRDLLQVNSVTNVACGTAYHAGLVGAMAIEALARIPARAEIASEYRHRRPIVSPDTLFFAISQSGETADTLGAVQEIRLKGGHCMGVVNVVGSTIARECGAGTYVYAGPEVAVASTKAFTSQVTALLLFTLMLGRTHNLSLGEGKRVARVLKEMPSKVAEYLQRPGPIDEATAVVRDAPYVLFLGRGFSYAAALEGALKLKEIAYVACEAYPAG